MHTHTLQQASRSNRKASKLHAFETNDNCNPFEEETNEPIDPNNESTMTTRRGALKQAFVTASITLSTSSYILTQHQQLPAIAADADTTTNNISSSSMPGTSPDAPICILGASGRTGMAVAETLTKAGMYACTMTRSGSDPFQIIKLPPDAKAKLQHYATSGVDVRNSDAVLAALRNANASGVIFAASASKQGGSARDVDSAGVANVATAVKQLLNNNNNNKNNNKQCKLVVISALALDRPESKGYKVTNSMGGYVDKIMDYKLEGEQAVRSALGRGSGNYVIVRPGVLLSGKTRNGAADIEVNQGDMIGGGLSRDELAGVCVGAMMSEAARGVTVEAYRKSTRTKLQPEFDNLSGNERSAESYAALFSNASRD